MPHLILEYTDNIPERPDFHKLFHEFHRILQRHADIKINNCKSRAIQLDTFLSGSGADGAAYIHLAVRIFSGRSQEVLHTIGEKLRAVLMNEFVITDDNRQLQITVEINEIDKQLYFKYSS